MSSRVCRLAALLALALAALLPPARAQQGADTLRFDILEFVVEGDTVLGAAAIERAVYPFLGPQRSVADAEAARKALEKAYQDAGFLSVNVLLPAQKVGEGSVEVRLQVVQSAVEKLRITGAQHHLPSQMREALPSLAAGSVPNFEEMQAELGALARARPDLELTPILAAGSVPGTMAVELKAQDKAPLHGSLELNSKQSQNTERGRLEATLRHDNLFQRGHAAGLVWFYSPRRPAEANILSLAYALPLGGPGDRLQLFLTHSDSDTPTPLGGATVSRGDTLRARWRDELGGPAGLQHALSWGLTWRDLRDANRDVAGISTTSPSLEYPSFGVGYELVLSAADSLRQTTLQADLNVGLAGLNRRTVDCFGTPLDQFECKRAGAQPGFQVLSVNAQHREPLGQWQLLGRLQGQLASGPLVSAEQVVYGGVDSVRGYYEGEQAGDVGLALRAELSTPPWALGERARLRLQGFWDRAHVRKLEALAGEIGHATLGSAGLGLRLETRFGLEASLDWARVLVDTRRLDSTGSAVPLSGAGAGRGQRWELSVRQSF